MVSSYCNVFAQNKNTDETINRIMDNSAKELFKTSKAYSISVGVIKDGKTFTKHYGEIDKGNKANNKTYFEVASVTKVMTGYLLAKAVLEKKISLDDDIRKYLNGDYPNLEYNGTPIRIKDLITYESAIPNVLPDEREIRNINDNARAFKLAQLTATYTKDDFLRDLKSIKLDTIPGTKYHYSNPALEITGLILENVNSKNYEDLVRETVWSQLNINHTKFKLNANEHLANGYNSNNVLMPNFVSNLWGSSGAKTRSTLGDLMQFLHFELNKKDEIIQESQRNIKDSKKHWYGYFWDWISITQNGQFSYKHGGAFGHNTLFAIYPEQNIGICIIINISGEETHNALVNTVYNLADNLIHPNAKKEIYGYRIENDNLIFSYRHAENLNAKLIHSVSVAGTFNDWNPENKTYQFVQKNKNTFELSLPKSQFEKGKTYGFKFVINQTSWLSTPQNATNCNEGDDNYLTFKID